MSHTHTRMHFGEGSFTCIICGELIDPTRSPWTTIEYNLDDRGLSGVRKWPSTTAAGLMNKSKLRPYAGSKSTTRTGRK